MTTRISPVISRWGTSGSPKANAALTATFLAIASVLRIQSVSDGAGGFVDTWAMVATYACNFNRLNVRPREIESSVRIQDLTYWNFSFVPGLDIRVTDRLQVGTRSFEIVGAGDGSSNVVLYLICQEIL
jgi:hypothetical protein